MFGRIFNQANLIHKSLDASWQRNEVIAQNIANVNTPKYKSKALSFDDEFRRALLAADPPPARPRGHVSLRGNATESAIRDWPEDRRKPFEKPDPMTVRPSVIENKNLNMKMDGNNVDIESEMNEAAKNAIYYNTMLSKVSSDLGRLKTAVKDLR